MKVSLLAVKPAEIESRSPARLNNPTSLPVEYRTAFEVRSKRNKPLGFVAGVDFTRLARPIYTVRAPKIREWWAFDRDLRVCVHGCKSRREAIEALLARA